MAKSSKKQCRKPRPPKQGSGFVVVSAHDMRKMQGNKRTESMMERGKGKMKMSKDVTGRSNDSNTTETREDLHPFKGSTTSGGKRGFLFISTTMRPERLYYLLHVQHLPSVSKEERSGAQREEGCHALVFVGTIPAAQELLAQLKALSVWAFAVHERTPRAQVISIALLAILLTGTIDIGNYSSPQEYGDCRYFFGPAKNLEGGDALARPGEPLRAFSEHVFLPPSTALAKFGITGL